MGTVELPPMLGRHADVGPVGDISREELGLPVVFEVCEFAEGLLVGLEVRGEELGHFFEALHDLVVGKHVVVVIAGREAVGDVMNQELHPLPPLPVDLGRVGLE